VFVLLSRMTAMFLVCAGVFIEWLSTDLEQDGFPRAPSGMRTAPPVNCRPEQAYLIFYYTSLYFCDHLPNTTTH